MSSLALPKSLQLYARSHVMTLLLSTLGMIALFIISRYHYLLFHTLVEGFSLIIAGTIFALTWNARSFLDNGYLLVFGVSFFFIGGLDFFHTITYMGMSVVPIGPTTDTANTPTQFWIAARYIQALTLVIAPFFLRRKPPAHILLAVYAVASAGLALAVFGGVFPTAYITGHLPPLTPFKIASEYGVISLYIIGIALLIRIRAAFNPDILRLLVASIVINIFSEFAFTGYIYVNDVVNTIGHCLKVVGFYLAYKAIIETGFLKPQQVLYRELAQSEAALRASESRERARAAQLEAIMDVTPAVMWIAHDTTARQVSGNRASAELLHLPANANHSRFEPLVAGRFKFLDKNGREMRPEELALHISALTGQPLRGIQETFVFQDGTTRHLYGNVAPLLDDSGRPSGAVAAFMDMTERVLAERALAESERRYRTLFETMAEGFVLHEAILDDAGRIVDFRFMEINPAFEGMMRLTREALVGHTIRDLSQGRPSPWIDKFAQILRSGQPARFEEYSAIAQRYLEVLVNPISETVCAIMALDVTVSHLSQAALRLSEARLRRLVESNIIGVNYSDVSGQISLANDAFLTIIGYTRGDFEASGINWTQLTPPEFAYLDERGMAEANERGACTPYEKEFVRKDGTRVPILIGYAYLAEEKPLYVAFILDLTSQKRAEASAREAAARLERSNHELQNANRELERANRELQDFAFVASHDLQEPLRKIQAFGERLVTRESDRIDAESKDYLARMLNASTRMRAMIDALLELSRVTTRGRPFEQVDLNAVAQEAISDLEVRIERSRGRVEVGSLPSLEADPLQMQQLLLNLIGNGLKFHQPDITPVVEVVGEYTPDGQMVIIKVKDNGIGFDEQYLDRIFQPFQRLNGKTQYEGSGIGLSICRKIAERHAGTITAESKPGEGSTFIVKLPAHHQQEKMIG